MSTVSGIISYNNLDKESNSFEKSTVHNISRQFKLPFNSLKIKNISLLKIKEIKRLNTHPTTNINPSVLVQVIFLATTNPNYTNEKVSNFVVISSPETNFSPHQ